MTEPTVRIEHWQHVPPDGAEVDLYGFEAWEIATGRRLGDDALRWGPRKWGPRGVARFEVVGESFNMKGLQHHGFARGAPVELRAEANPHGVDGVAVAVYEESGSAQGGYIPNADLPVVLGLLRDEGGGLDCIVWREAHRRSDALRCSLEVLVHRRGVLYMDPLVASPAVMPPAPPARPPLPRRRGLLNRLLGR